ncbi:flavin reductase family protein [Actinomadura parmotrematis]|uniref:Flavin reductase family protein n=1 Tax=Actinomadura parmotrematis TaxID=2864039 RepID=A0ABS7G5X4_9ACTN|nr:flavin reductase family protein [Actinomadura parmotrematis]MBW8487212.1 flavin reductase family protein [Actinomadura parmotrematis]
MPSPDGLPDAFRTVMRHVAATVTVITATGDGGRQHGMTATAVSSLSMDPPALLVCVNQRTLLHDLLLRGTRFCVNVLAHDQSHVSAAFSGAVAPEDRFAVGDWGTDEHGLRFLADGIASLVCRNTATIPYGSHTIFVGEVTGIRRHDAVRPLLYQNTRYCRCEPIEAVPA